MQLDLEPFQGLGRHLPELLDLELYPVVLVLHRSVRLDLVPFLGLEKHLPGLLDLALYLVGYLLERHFQALSYQG